jgi:hypothetical protein
MSPEQYRWYVAEAELPGMASQYARVLLGGLLRKPPTVKLPPSVPEAANDWINSKFTEDHRSIIAFLDDAVFEELTTSRCWVSVDFPVIDKSSWEKMSPEQRDRINPYPVTWRSEDVINWQVVSDSQSGRPKLSRVIFRYIDKTFKKNSWHPELVPTLAEHYLDSDSGDYTVQYYIKEDAGAVSVNHGQLELQGPGGTNFDLFGESNWVVSGDPIVPLAQGVPMKVLPVFPLNGEISLETPMLTPIIDKEIAIYNLLSRRNHLLYGASTYTPVIKSNMQPEEFEVLVRRGLGSWILLNPEDSTEVLSTPTEALADLDRAIEAGRVTLAELGTHMLSPDQAQSGVAMQIRNAPQTAQLGTLNTKISDSMKRIIALMLTWKYGSEVDSNEIEFNMSGDFDSGVLSPETASLITDWYQNRLIPRSVWLKTMQKLEMIPTDYNDEEGKQEISQDPLVNDPGYEMSGEF